MGLTPIGAKISDAKTPTIDSSERIGKTLKEYVPEDPESDPNLSDPLLSESDSSDNSNYRCRRCYKKKKYQKRKKRDSNKPCVKLMQSC